MQTNAELEKVRSELCKLIQENASKETILKKSQELDVYIVEQMKKQYNTKCNQAHLIAVGIYSSNIVFERICQIQFYL